MSEHVSSTCPAASGNLRWRCVAAISGPDYRIDVIAICRRQRWSPIAAGRALLAGGRAAGRRRPASGEGLELRAPRRAAAALRHGGDPGAAWRADRALSRRARDRARRQLPRRRRPGRLADSDRGRCARCSAAATGSGSPATTIPIRPTGIGGRFAADVRDRARSPSGMSRREAPDGEIAGHLHPVARVTQRGRTVSRRCFASDGKRLVMPAFGAYAGGLNVRDRAFAECSARWPSPRICWATAALRRRRPSAACRISPAGTPRWRTSR